MEYRPTIGLEIHAELNTATKMFCSCRNDPNEARPNVNICPVCMAHPGTLPVINREAVRKIFMIGGALGGKFADGTNFDRKNYFYPDIPKGYQISQYERPFISDGVLADVAIERVHLEEDTARSSHEGEKSVVDFNRAGVPLMELVTKPVIHSASQAGFFARELQLLLRTLGASEANMEKGEMRVEANISISATEKLGTKVEVKNLNSFRSVERAIAYEVKRQQEVLEQGGTVVQETRGWDENRERTFSQRKKESSHDYRYFPEPDLPELRISAIPAFASTAIVSELPELPDARRARYHVLGLKQEDVDTLVREPLFGTFFDWSLEALSPKTILLAVNYLMSDAKGAYEKKAVAEGWFLSKENAGRFAKLMELTQSGILSSRGAKDTLHFMYTEQGDPRTLAESHNLMQESNEEVLILIAQKIIERHSDIAEEYRKGKTSALQFLIGQGMREAKGSANPMALRAIFTKLLG